MAAEQQPSLGINVAPFKRGGDNAVNCGIAVPSFIRYR